MAAVDDDDLIDEERLISLLEFSPDVQEAIDQVRIDSLSGAKRPGFSFKICPRENLIT
jgi:hypothetical protein